MEGDGVGGLGPRHLVQARGVEHEQKGALFPGIEHDRQQDAVILGIGRRGGHEHGLAWIKARRVPG